MPRIIGRLTKLGLGKETTRGTAVAPTFWIPVRDLGFDDRLELTDNESGFGNIAAIQDAQITKIWADGDYEGKIYDKSVGLELTALFGQSPTSVQRASSGVYDHTYAMLNSNQHQSVTAAVAESNYSGRYPLGMIDSWEFQAELGDYIHRTVSLISNPSASSSETPAYTNENEFIPKHMAVKLAAVGADLTAAASSKIRSFSFTINKNVSDETQVLGSNNLDDIPNMQLEVSGEFSVFYDARTYHTLAAAGTHQSIRVEMLNTDVTIGTTHNPALRFDFNDVVLSRPERDFGNNDQMTQSVGFRATLDLTTGAVMSARLTNLYNGTAY